MKLLQYTWKNSMMKIANSKMAVFVILMIVVSRSYVGAIRQFSVAVDYPSSWCVFPFAMCSFSYLIMFWFGVIYANSDVPFMQHVNMYHAIRVGRKCWALGQIGGIFIRSIVLTVVAVICTILPLLPDIEWSNEWGKLLRTAATTRAILPAGPRAAVPQAAPAAIIPVPSVIISRACPPPRANPSGMEPWCRWCPSRH